MQALAVVLALLALAPFLWLLLMSFKTNAEIFRFPPRLLFDATLGQLRSPVDLGVPQFLRQQPDRERGLDGDRRW